MKKLLLFISIYSVIMAGCDKKNKDGTYTSYAKQKVYIIDSCEYIGVLDWGNSNYLSHKGNCKYC